MSMSNVLAKKAVLASLNISRWTARAMDQKVTDEVHAQHGTSREAGRYWKRLIDKSAMSKIGSVATAARNYHYEHTLPWLDGAGGGQRVLPSEFFSTYAKQMQTFDREYGEAAAEFALEYPNMKRAAKRALNGLYREADYPKESEIRGLFTFDLTIIPCPDIGKDFRIAVGDEFVDDIRRELEGRMNGVLEASLRDSAERIVETVGHMAERLRAYKPPAEKGEKTEGAFRDSLVENVRDLAKLLPAFNMAENVKMAEITARIQASLCAIDAEDLRNDEKARRKVAAAAASIVRDVSAFI